MAKHVVIDAIARSGTTLMSALLRSQDKTMAFCPGFNEPLSCKNVGEWPHGICRQEFLHNPEIDFAKFQQESLSQIMDYSQYYGLGEDEWKSIVFDAKSTSEIRENMERAFPEIEVFCYRWNQAICYFHEWIKNGDNFLWLSMIRNPLDRAVSSFEKHHWQFEESLKNTISFGDKLQNAKLSNKFYLTYYEDLVESPQKIIRDIYSFFGLEIKNINLTDIKGSNGKDFIPQSSQIKNVYKKSDGYLVEAERYQGIYKKQINRYHHAYATNEDGNEVPMMDTETYETFMHLLSRFPEYDRYFQP